VAAEVRTVDLVLQPTAGVSPPRDLAALTSIAELPPYFAEVVKAVAGGVQTSREFAKSRGISITNASERLRLARRLGWIVPSDGRYLPRQGIRYRLDPTQARN
jgi:DNA-directed RNA polymerase specialized sigma24 family protein